MADPGEMNLWRAVLRPVASALIGLFSAVVLAGADSYPAPRATVPDFSGPWALANSFDFAPPPPGVGPGPMINTSGDRLVPVGNYDSPILQPWAAAEVKKHGDTLLAGKIAPNAHTSCVPLGLPYVLQLRENVQLLQTPDWIMITYQNDNQRRLVRINAEHAAHPVPSWYGDSVGHYEGSDTLIIDTIGIAVHEVSAIDRFGTPHTEAMHVVERYHLSDDRKTMRVDFTVADPGTFTTAWHASVTYGRGPERPGEHVCAENNREAAAGQAAIPTATRADF